jgi:hypothetical protein
LASNLEFQIDETEGEVIDPSTEGMSQPINDSSKPKSVESDEYSGASSELTESEPAENEVQSPKVNIRGSLSSIQNEEPFILLIYFPHTIALNYYHLQGPPNPELRKAA